MEVENFKDLRFIDALRQCEWTDFLESPKSVIDDTYETMYNELCQISPEDMNYRFSLENVDGQLDIYLTDIHGNELTTTCMPWEVIAGCRFYPSVVRMHNIFVLSSIMKHLSFCGKSLQQVTLNRSRFLEMINQGLRDVEQGKFVESDVAFKMIREKLEMKNEE